MKAGIFNVSVIPPEQHLLSLSNGEFLEDGHTLSTYGIQNTSTVTLMCDQGEDKMSIYIKMITGKTLTPYVDKHEAVESVKTTIQEKEGISAQQQRLVYLGR